MRENPFVTVNPDDLSPDVDRWSFSRPPPGSREALIESLRAHGQLFPLAALENRERLQLVDGAARLEIMRELGAHNVNVVLLPEENIWGALLELRNRCGQPLNPVEVGLYLKKRMAHTGETPEMLAPEIFPSLGLAPRPGAGEDPLWLAGLEEVDAARFVSGEAPLAGVRVLANAPREDALAALKALRPFRLGANKFVETVRWMCECAWREKTTVADWLAANPPPPPEEGGETLRRMVWRARYPKLAELSEAFEGDARELPLPKNAAFSHPTNFDGGKLALTLRFGSVRELARQAAEVADSAETGHFSALERYLD